MLIRKRFLLLLPLIIAMQPAWAAFSDGAVAYSMGQYEKAYNILRSIAETTNDSHTPLAEYYLGMMYMNGQGVKLDYSKASEWFRKAAENRLPEAQYKLGTLYFNGQGVPRDYERAYAWYRVASVHNHQLSMKALPRARQNLSATELRDAEKLSREYIEKYGPEKNDKQGATQ